MAPVTKDSTSTIGNNVTDLIFNITEMTDPSQCIVFKYEGLTPWDNPDNLVSAHTEDLVNRVRYTIILPILFLIGAPANVINMAVFYKQGLKERINVCLFSLSLADFLNLLFDMVFYGEQAYLQLISKFTTKERYGPLMRVVINHNLLGFYGNAWVSQVISAIIASERCFCILHPLRSQTVLSTSTTTVTIVITYVVLVTLYSIIMTRYRAVCVHDPVTGSDSWTFVPSQFYLNHHNLIEALDTYVFGMVVPGVVMGVVIVTTIVTMIKLRQVAAWRSSVSSNITISEREESLTVMLVYNSIFFIVCASPFALARVAGLLTPELAPGRRQHNLFFVVSWMLDTMVYINSTFNIFIYYNMGSRYRQIFWQMMGRSHRTSKMNKTSACVDNIASSSQGTE